MTKKKDIWHSIMSSLTSEIPHSDLKAWFSHITLKEINPQVALLEVPNKVVANWLTDNYITTIEDAFKKNCSLSPAIRFTYAKPPVSKVKGYFGGKNLQQRTFGHPLTPSWTFENFITSKSNQFAYSSALEVANRPGDRFNPLYIFSKPGNGKTHLLHAIGNHVRINSPATDFAYICLGRFSPDLSANSLRSNFSQFKESLPDLDLILIDDIDLLSGHQKAQKDMISLFDAFYGPRKQLVASANRPPSLIRGLLPQLSSRLESGLLAEMDLADNSTKMRILEVKASQEKLNIPDDVIFFLANSTNNLNTLMKYLTSLQAYNSLYHRKIDMYTVKSIIKARRIKNLTVHDIQETTANHFSISLGELLSNRNVRRFSYPRQIAMYLCRSLTDLSYQEIGRSFGNKHHSTVLYAVKRLETGRNDRTSSISYDIDTLRSLLL
jgi:chromosomal replication initiator protein